MLPQQIGADLGSASGTPIVVGVVVSPLCGREHPPKVAVLKNPREHPVAPVCRPARKMPRRVASPQQVSSAKSRWFVELMQPREVGKLAAYLRKIQWLR